MDMGLFAVIQLYYVDFSGVMPLVSSILSVTYIVMFCWVLAAIIYNTMSYTGDFERNTSSFSILVEGAGEYRSFFSY